MRIRKITPEEAEARRLRALADAAEAQARIARAHAETAEQQARAHTAQAHAQAEQARAQAEQARANAVEERRKIRAELELAPLREAHAQLQEAQAEQERAQARERRAHRRRGMRKALDALQGRAFVFAAFVGVNLIAVDAQAQAFGAGPEGWAKAGVLECVALAVGWIGHQALKLGRPAKGKRLASYAIALLMAAINYSHFSHGLEPTFEAVAYAFCSLVSPWLWGMYSRHLHADKLEDAGVEVVRAPDFPILRWVFWPRPTLAAYRWGVRTGQSDWRTCVDGWAGEQEEMRKIAEAEAHAAEAERDAMRTQQERMRTSAEQGRTWSVVDDVRADLMHAYGHLITADRIADALLGPAPGARALAPANTQPSGAHAAAAEANGQNPAPHDGSDDDGEGGPALPPLPAIPAPAEAQRMDEGEKLSRGRLTVYLARLYGIDLAGRGAELGRAYDMSARWGQVRVKEETRMLFALPGRVLDSDDSDDGGSHGDGDGGGEDEAAPAGHHDSPSDAAAAAR